jgi:hypothetical protein
MDMDTLHATIILVTPKLPKCVYPKNVGKSPSEFARNLEQQMGE